MSENSDYNKIDDNIFIGSHRLTQNKDLMKSLNIQRILTIGCKQLDRLQRFSNIYYKDISLIDKYEERITQLYDSFVFIDESQKYNENVLINCISGNTFSAVVLIAFLIKKYKFSSEKAINFVSEKRSICIIDRFSEELQIWQNITLDFNTKNHIILNRFLFRRLGHRMTKTIDEIYCGPTTVGQQFNKILISYRRTKSYLLNLLKPKWETQTFYSCRSCETVVFLESDIVANNQLSDTTVCNYTYITPEHWIIGQIIEKRIQTEINWILGPICCYCCNRIIGEYDWRPKHDNQCPNECPIHRRLDPFLVFRCFSDKIIIHKK